MITIISRIDGNPIFSCERLPEAMQKVGEINERAECEAVEPLRDVEFLQACIDYQNACEVFMVQPEWIGLPAGKHNHGLS